MCIQRRRWLNGSFFSLIYYVTKFHNLLGRSDHSWFRRIALMVQFFYQCSALILSWFGVGSLYLSLVVIFQLAMDAILDSSNHIMWMFSLLYGFLTVLQVRALKQVPSCHGPLLTPQHTSRCVNVPNSNHLIVFPILFQTTCMCCAMCVDASPLLPQLLLGLGSKPNDTIKIYFVCSLGFGVIMLLAVGLSVWQLAHGR